VEPRPKLVAIIGPSGSGKTGLAVELCQHFNGEIISCDSKQVYRGMDTGTAKEKDLPVPQHLLDIKDPGQKITVAEYQQLAYQEIEHVISAGKQPFLVGCSMLYAESVLNGYTFDESAVAPRYQCLKMGISMEREELRRRIAARTEQWSTGGLLEEIKSLLAQGVSEVWLKSCGQEYRYFTELIEGKIDLETAKTKTNISLSQYAKRQYTWWRRHADVVWVQSAQEAKEQVGAFLQV
jgi:tRNA dimethylallyltransferase